MTKKYVDVDQVLSRNAVISMIIGHRSGGKTYGAKDLAIRQFLKHGHQFVYVRRYDKELVTKSTLFDDIQDKYNIDVRVEGINCYFRDRPTEEDAREMKPAKLRIKYPWKLAGYFVGLNQQQQFKGATWPKVRLIIFDEFINENDRVPYLPNEVDQLLSLYFTIDREREEVRILMLSNAARLDNPYFKAYSIKAKDLATQAWIRRNGGFVLVHNFENKDNEARMAAGTLGQISTDRYAKYAIGNQFADAHDSFIIPRRPAGYTPLIKITDGDVYLEAFTPAATLKTLSDRSIWVKISTSEGQALSCDPSRPIENAPYMASYIKMLRTYTHRLLVTYESPEARLAWYDLVKP